jgi:uncharacterized protein YpmB
MIIIIIIMIIIIMITLQRLFSFLTILPRLLQDLTEAAAQLLQKMVRMFEGLAGAYLILTEALL